MPDYSARNFVERGFTVGIGGYEWKLGYEQHTVLI